MNLTKEVKELFTKNCEILMKINKKDKSKYKDISCSWI